MPRIHRVQSSNANNSATPSADLNKRATRQSGPKNNTANGLDIATSVAAPRRTSKNENTNKSAFKLAVEMMPWSGPKPIVSKPGDEKPLPLSAVVEGNYDGDTLTLKDRGIRVRVQNVNTPELKPLEQFGPEAGKVTHELVVGKKVALNFDPAHTKDHYGRLIAQVVLPTGEDLALKLIEKGMGHLFIVSEQGNPGDFKALLAAQESAKSAKLGIWSTSGFQGDFSISSFHSNGYGNEREDPNGEYLRMVNITNRPLELSGYTLSNKAGQKFPLPKAIVKPGHTVQVFTGAGTNVTDPKSSIRVFLGSQTPVWNNFDEQLTLKDANDKVVTSRVHTYKQRDISTLSDPVTQKTVVGLGQDMETTYTVPARLPVHGKLLVDDGDTVFIASPKDGVFKVEVSDPAVNRKIKRDIHVADQREAPAGMLAVRFLGVDTPETHYEVNTAKDQTVFFSQGRAGEIAAERLMNLLKNADAVAVTPHPKRPFDTYSRLLGTVHAHLKDGTTVNVSEWLVENGLGEMAIYYSGKEFDHKEYERFRQAAKKAVEGGLGIYSKGEGRCDERPVDFRRRLRAAGTAPAYVIDVESRTVYTGADVAKIKPYNRLYCFQPRLKQAIKDLGLKRGPGVPD